MALSPKAVAFLEAVKAAGTEGLLSPADYRESLSWYKVALGLARKGLIECHAVPAESVTLPDGCTLMRTRAFLKSNV